MKELLLLTLLASSATVSAQEADSVKTQHIKEVVVTAKNHVAIKDGVSYIQLLKNASLHLIILHCWLV